MASGLGVSILPASLQAIKVPDVTWRRLSVNAGTLESRIYLVRHAERGMTPQRKRFIDIVSLGVQTS